MKERYIADSESAFPESGTAGEKVASSTRLGVTGRSIGTVALDIVEAEDGSLAGKSALLIGTGFYARVLAGALRSRKCGWSTWRRLLPMRPATSRRP